MSLKKLIGCFLGVYAAVVQVLYSHTECRRNNLKCSVVDLYTSQKYIWGQDGYATLSKNNAEYFPTSRF
jgi:hypothetical protein